MSNDPALIEQFHAAAGTSPLRRALGGKGPATKIVEWPDDGPASALKGVPLAVRVLSEEERALAHAAAVRWVRDSAGFDDDYVHSDEGRAEVNIEMMVQTLALALVEPAPPHATVAKDANDLRSLLTADETRYLFEQYLDLLAARSPFSSKAFDALMEEVDQMGKGMIPLSRLSGYDSASLRTITRELVGRHARQMSGSFSDTSPSPAPTQT